MKYAQLVMGPAGCGKSTYCSTLTKHGQIINRILKVVNLDPAAEHFDYQPFADIRELIHLDDAMEDEDLKFGPNGGLVFCMEFLLQNIEWLQEQLEDIIEDDYVIFDCPGQIELYTHMNVMRQLVDTLQNWNFRVCGIFILDSQFMVEPSKFISGSLAALSAMVNLEIPHVNVLNKLDLLNKEAKQQLHLYLEPDVHNLLGAAESNSKWHQKHWKFSEAIGHLIDDYSLVKFCPLDIQDEDSIGNLFEIVNSCTQYGEDLDVRTHDFEIQDDEDEKDDARLYM